MNHWNDGCSVGEGGFIFCVVDCADGGKEIFFQGDSSSMSGGFGKV